ncbi:DMT family transporter [Sphingobium nicotianae]|uniref:DMT family transporter n=1 Tax=Sphingobium nicotianae TaxID=2782607 RepID=A0A9X1DEF9_9SPHN|nr:DMT family transporter [Sphingobium nicotianae]MBT2188687.1 DMT family transporter [Sphingobium nicotianae]
MTSPRASTLLPFAVACLGVAIFSVMDAIMKGLSIAIGPYNALLWRTLTGAVMLAPAFLAAVGRVPDRRILALHVSRSLAGGLSVLLFFWGLVRVPLAQGIALSFVAPLVALGLAALFLKERVGRRAVAGSLVAFAGVLVILAGQSGAQGKGGTIGGAVAILIASIFWAISLVIGRRQSMAASPIEVAFAFNLVAACFYGTAAPWLATVPDVAHWPTILLASVVGTSAIMLLAWSYARAEAQRLVVVEYTAFIWASLLGWWLFGEHVLPATVAGAAMIVAGCLWAARQQPGRPHPNIEPEAA